MFLSPALARGDKFLISSPVATANVQYGADPSHLGLRLGGDPANSKKKTLFRGSWPSWEEQSTLEQKMAQHFNPRKQQKGPVSLCCPHLGQLGPCWGHCWSR